MSLNLESNLNQETEKFSLQHAEFKRLLKKIKQQKDELGQWEIAQRDIHQRANGELLPKFSELHAITFKQLEYLWEHKQSNILSDVYLVKLDEKIQSLAKQLLTVAHTLLDPQYEKVKEILAEYHLNSIDSENEAHILDHEQLEIKKTFLINLVCEEFGVDPDFIDFEFNPDDLEDLLQKMNQKFEKNKVQIQQQQYEKNEKEAQKKLARSMSYKLLKTIYLKIASIIHPDREQDEHKKNEKTIILQSVNEAYKNKDLASLLQLQDQMESAGNSSLVKDQIQFYNILLEEHIEQLAQKIDDIIYTFDWNQHIHLFLHRKIKVKDLYKKYDADLLNIRQQLEASRLDLDVYQDIEQLKKLWG